jgi:hypothetical protein
VKDAAGNDLLRRLAELLVRHVLEAPAQVQHASHAA